MSVRSQNQNFDDVIQGQSYQQSKPPSQQGSRSQNQLKPQRIMSANVHSTKNTASIPLSDLMRMKEKISNEGQSREQEMLQREKADLQDKSQQRVKNWPNTLNALRKNKADAKFERFSKDEIERRRIDAEEKIYQEKVRKETLEKANKQLYDQEDPVKKFQSKLVLMDTLQEREEQIAIKKQFHEIGQYRDIKFIEKQKEELKKAMEEEAKKQLLLEEKRRQNAKVLREQHDEQKKKTIKQMQSDKIEGEIIKAKALELLEQEKEEERKRREQEKSNQKFIRENNEFLATMREQNKLKEEEEAKKIQFHAERKDKVNEMKARRAEQLFQIKQDLKQQMIDTQTKKLQEIKDKQNQFLNKQIKEAEIKAEQAELIKKQKQLEMKAGIDVSRQQNVQKRRIQSAKERQDNELYQQFWVEKNVKIHERELQDLKEKQERARELQQFHVMQAEQKKKVREQNFMKELEEADKQKNQFENQTGNFNSWAEKMIKQWKDDGKEIGPLLKELKTFKQV